MVRRTASRCFRSACRRRRAVRKFSLLHFETLESRRLLATLTVGGGGDFPSIQQAVNNARSGDTIELADGDYAESVDLSRMGSSIGRQPGNLSIQGSGPAAVVTSPGGPAFFNSAAFAGDLTLNRLTLQSPANTAGSDSGLVLDGYSGTLQVTGVLITDATDTGIRIANAAGTVTIRETEISDSGSGEGDHGIVVDRLDGVLVLRDNTVRDVADDGVVVLVGGSDELVASLSDNVVAGDPIGFSTTNRGVRVDASGSARLDVTLDNGSLDDLDESGLTLRAAGTSQVQARIDDNILFNTNQSAAIDLRVEDSAALAFSFSNNTLSDMRAEAFLLTLADSAQVNAYLQNNLFFNIGDGAGDDALVIASESGSDGVLNALLDFNDFVTVTGTGSSITADGETVFNITAIENSYSDVNTRSGTAAVEIRKAGVATAADINLDFRDNTVNQTVQGDFRFEQRGTGQFRLEGTESNAALQIENTNSGMFSSTGTITVVPDGSFDGTRPLLLGDLAWNDANGDGIQGDDENGLADILFLLSGTESGSGRSVQRTTLSTPSGQYQFSGLLPGDYTVSIGPRFGFTLAETQQGGDGSLDNDFPRSSRSADVTLTAETDVFDVDAGFIRNWQNPRLPTDVNDDGLVAPIDALLVINDLNSRGARPLSLPPLPPNEPPPYLDVNGDTQVAPIDVLQVINFLNSGASGEGEAGGRPQPATTDSLTDPARLWPAMPLAPPTEPHGVPSAPLHTARSSKTVAPAAGYRLDVPATFRAPTAANESPARGALAEPRGESSQSWEDLLELLAGEANRPSREA